MKGGRGGEGHGRGLRGSVPVLRQSSPPAAAAELRQGQTPAGPQQRFPGPASRRAFPPSREGAYAGISANENSAVTQVVSPTRTVPLAKRKGPLAFVMAQVSSTVSPGFTGCLKRTLSRLV